MKLNEELRSTLRQALICRESELARAITNLSSFNEDSTRSLVSGYRKELRNINVLLCMI